MLKLATDKEINEITNFCRDFPIGVKISSNALAYGLEKKLFSCWIQCDKKTTAVVGNFCGAVTVVANDDADFEELSLFLASSNGSLCAEKSIFEKCGIVPNESKIMFAFDSRSENYDDVVDDCDLRSLYNLVCENIENSFDRSEESFLNFLSDITYRKNRNLGRVKAIIDNQDKSKNVIGSCVTAAEDSERALISAVSSDKNHRGKGIGKKVVLSMVYDLQSNGKKAFVIALNKSAEGFYNKIGFRQICEICFR